MNIIRAITTMPELVSAFGECKAGLGSVHTLTFKEGKEKRRDAQNRLYYHWLGEIAEQSGYGRNYWRGVFKWEIGCPILAADDPDFNRLVYDKFIEAYTYEEVIEIMGTDHIQVTSDMNVKQMQKFLDEVKLRAYKEGYLLTDLDEIYKNLSLSGEI